MVIFLRKALKVNSIATIIFRINFIHSMKYFRFIKVLSMAFITSHLFLKRCSLPQIAAGKFLFLKPLKLTSDAEGGSREMLWTLWENMKGAVQRKMLQRALQVI